METTKRLLLVDDDKIHRVIYSSIATKLEFQVDPVASPGEADVALNAHVYDCVILDLMLGEESGRDVLDTIRTLERKPPVILVTGAPEKVVEDVFRYGRDFGIQMLGPVRKPVNVVVVRTILRSVASHANLARTQEPGVGVAAEFSI